MKKTLDSLVWIPKSLMSEQDQVLMMYNDLTIASENDYSSRQIQLFEEIDTHIGVPRYYFINKYGYDFEDNTVFPYINFPAFNGTLRDGQKVGTKAVLDRIATDCKYGGILQAKCGAGKTVSALYLASKLRSNTLVLVHKNDLLHQWKEACDMFLPSASVGIVQGSNRKFRKSPITVATFQTVKSQWKSLNKQGFFTNFGTTIIDECFIAGTKVDGKNIEEIKVGDLVRSVNHNTGKIEMKPVLKIHKNPLQSEKLMDLHLNGASITCTKNHPFYIKGKGYIPAITIKKGDEVLYVKENSPMRKLCKTSRMFRKRERFGEAPLSTNICNLERKECLLFGGMQVRENQENSFEHYGENQQEICIRENEEKQSNGQGRDKKESLGYLKENGTQTPSTRRKWYRNDETAETLKRCTRGWLDGRAHYSYERVQTPFNTKNGNPLQNRLNPRRVKDSSRSRWEKPLHKSETSPRQKERKDSDFIRVESVSLHEQGNTGRCSESSFVYNLEVKDNHNYFAEDILVHNCHHVGAETFNETLKLFSAKIRLGLTATPRRRDGLEKAFEYNIGPILTVMEGETLTGEFKQSLYESNLNINKFKMWGGKGNVSISKMITAICEDPYRNHFISEVLRLGASKGRKILVLSNRKAQLQHLHDEWKNKVGDSSGLYVGGMSKAQLNASTQKQMIFGTTNMFAEGTDIPSLDTLCLISPMSDIEQMIGRIQRLYAGKKVPFVWDLVDNNKICLAMGKKRRKYLTDAGFTEQQ